VWSQSMAVDFAPPTIAGGVIFESVGSQLQAFNAATGAPLWNSGSSIAGAVQNGATLVNGRVYVVDWNDTIYAFGL
jgi:outer membrane protein assembly factor BamB